MTSKTLPPAVLQAQHHDVYPFIDPKYNLKGAAIGKTVLVTGSGSGIGAGIAEAFALAGAASLILAARRAAPLEETKASIAKLNPECHVLVVPETDITDENSLARLFAGLPTAPDIVVSNAGVYSGTAHVAEADPAVYWRDYEINVRGSFLVARAYIQAVRASERKRGGLLISVSSRASYNVYPGRSSYNGSKLALNKMSEHIDVEEQLLDQGGSGVRSVAMQPGAIMTPLVTPDFPQALLVHFVDTVQLAGGLAVYLSTERAGFLMGRYVEAGWDMEELEKAREQVVEGNLLRMMVTGMGY